MSEQAQSRGKNMLLAASIILLIGGIITVPFALFGMGLGALFGLNQTAAAGELEFLFLTYSILTLCMGVFQIVAAIFGIANRKRPERAGACVGMGIALVAVAVFSLILATWCQNFTVFLILSLLLPLLYVGGAFQNRPAHND